MTSEQAQENVTFYRKVKYPKVKNAWYKIFGCALDSIKTGETFTYKTRYTSLEFSTVKINGITYFRVKLPSGRYVWYPEPRMAQGEYGDIFTYMGVEKGMWKRLQVWHGLLFENIVQSSARDLLSHGLLCAEKGGYSVVGSIHDEGITEVPVKETNKSIEELNMLLCIPPWWAKGLPLAASGYVAKHYKKD